jgi:hypothetical protein
MPRSRREFITQTTAGALALLMPRWARGLIGPDVQLPIGMNLAGIADWETGFPFRNLMWGARLWLTRNQADGGPWSTDLLDSIPLDPNGYPLQVPLQVAGHAEPQILFTIVPNTRQPGRYVLLHDGEGEIAGLMNTRVVEARPGRVVLDMKHQTDGLEGIVLKRSLKGNHLRAIRIVPLADEQTDLDKNPFLPEFREFCQPFHCLRFMDWMCTNASLEETWATRKNRSFYTMVGASGDADRYFSKGPSKGEYLLSGGVAIEVCIQLCNALGIDAWFCVPHRADDDYIRQFATLVREQLDPKLNVYVEFSNEIWNWGFMQAQWMLKNRYAGEQLEKRGIKAWEDAEKTKGSSHPERIGALFRRCFGVWEDVFSGANRKRLVRVCAVQHAWLDTAERTLKYAMENGGTDTLSPAGYIGPGDREYGAWEQRGAALTAKEVIADLNRSFDCDSSVWTKAQAGFAKKYGVRYIVYEGGQHLQPKGQAELPYMPALAAAQQDPGMYDLYMRNLKLHQEIGCSLFCAFSSVGRQGSRYGSWGHMARYDQPLSEAPKMRAILDVNTPKQ